MEPRTRPLVGQHQFQRAGIALKRLRYWLDISGHSAVTLTSPAAVAWATGGVHHQVDHAACTSEVWAVVSHKGAYLIASEVESDRIEDEYQPAMLGFDDLLSFPWYESDGAVNIARSIEATGASDGHPDLGVDVTEDLVELRLSLSEPELQDLKSLGADVSDAMALSLELFEPGVVDLEIQSILAQQLERRGVRARILMVGGDDRLRRYRHPVTQGFPIWHMVMVVVVAERTGLHVATTRYASVEPLPGELSAAFPKLRSIKEKILAACRPGTTYGEVIDHLDSAYREAGYPNEWRNHYQGGPIGFSQREFEIAPANQDSRWYRHSLEVGTALAFNPSLPGGAKLEDTYILTESGLDPVTTTTAGGSVTRTKPNEYGVFQLPGTRHEV